MKRKAVFISTIVLLLITFSTFTYAQQQSNSNEIRTRVGNPTVTASSCPIPNGTPSCGSRNEPRGGCGHCSPAYTSAHGCDYESLAYALDVPAPYGADVYLPTINGSEIKWVFFDQYYNDSRTTIQRYGGTDEKSGQQYLIKFHHSLPNSGGGTKYSGEIGANICQAPCNVGTGPHTHIEFASVNSSGSYTWLDAPLYFCGG